MKKLLHWAAKVSTPRTPPPAPPKFSTETRGVNLTQDLNPILTPLKPILHFRKTTDVKTTKLPNGLTISSAENHSQLTVLNIQFRNSGIRYEKDTGAITDPNTERGLSTLANKLSFMSSEKYTQEDLMGLHDRIITESAVDYETREFSSSFHRDDLKEAIEMMSDTLLNGKYRQEDIDLSVKVLKEAQEEENQNPAMSGVLMDQMMEACFGRGSQLGRPALYIPERYITSEEIIRYQRDTLRPEDCVISGVGLEHDKLVKYCEKYFVFPEGKRIIDVSQAKWIGGESRLTHTHPALSFDKQNIPTLTAVIIGFPSPSFINREIFAAFVLETMLGGGDSFSAGGPGKGLQSIIHKRFLSQYHFHNMSVKHVAYKDIGVFGIHASSESDFAAQLPHAILSLVG